MVARHLGVLSRHRGFQNIDQPNPVFTTENSVDNNPIHKYTQHTANKHNIYGVKPIIAQRSPNARPVELHNVKPAQFWRTSGSVLNVDWLRTSSGTEKLSS